MTEQAKALTIQRGWFKIDRADDCIWLNDLRPLEPDEPQTSSMHMTPSQAIAVGIELIVAGHGPDERFSITRENKDE